MNLVCVWTTLKDLKGLHSWRSRGIDNGVICIERKHTIWIITTKNIYFSVEQVQSSEAHLMMRQGRAESFLRKFRHGCSLIKKQTVFYASNVKQNLIQAFCGIFNVTNVALTKSPRVVSFCRTRNLIQSLSFKSTVKSSSLARNFLFSPDTEEWNDTSKARVYLSAHKACSRTGWFNKHKKSKVKQQPVCYP